MTILMLPFCLCRDAPASSGFENVGADFSLHNMSAIRLHAPADVVHIHDEMPDNLQFKSTLIVHIYSVGRDVGVDVRAPDDPGQIRRS
jgi:hypothetical protein